MLKCIIILIEFTLLIQTNISFAAEQVATLTQAEGNVKIFSHPSKALPKDIQKQTSSDKAGPPHVLFEGEYFLVQDAKVGDSMEKGNILRTTPGSKARVVYENGDQINVGPGTAYRVSWDEGNSEKAQVRLNLAYGKLRGVIEKGGPRSHLLIKTRTAVMGVRGTDFYIAQGGQDGVTEVSIIRGAVEVTSIANQGEKVTVAAGYSAEVNFKNLTNKIVNPQVELRKTTQEELVGIQKNSTLKTVKTQPAPTEVKERILVLEKKASETALKDIRLADARLFNSIKPDKLEAVDDINQEALKNILKDAPKAPKKLKPDQSEIEGTKDDAYEKYFKDTL